MRLYKVDRRLESADEKEFCMTPNCCDSIQYARTRTFVFTYGEEPRTGVLTWVYMNNLELIT